MGGITRRKAIMIAGVVYVNPEGVRVQESEMWFEVMKAKETDYQQAGFELRVMGDFNAHIGLGAEQSPNRMVGSVGLCLECVHLCVGDQLSQCSERWMWEMKERRSVVDYILLSKGLVWIG